MVVAALLGGCASLKDGNESTIHVRAAHDPAKAIRYTLIGVKAMDHGDIDRAADKFLAAIDADDTYGPAHSNLGLLHYEQGNLYQAVLAFERAMELMPQDPIVYYNLGLTLEAAGKVHEAMDLYWQAVEMDAENPYYLGNLVRLRVKLGENGPDVVTELQDLILIETRPDWRRWADQLLALELNDALDRGPATPDFDPNRDRSAADEAGQVDNVIELTPGQQSSNQESSDATLPEPKSVLFLDEEIIPSPEFNAPRVESRPLPIRDRGSFQTLPRAIEMEPDRTLGEGDLR